MRFDGTKHCDVATILVGAYVGRVDKADVHFIYRNSAIALIVRESEACHKRRTRL